MESVTSTHVSPSIGNSLQNRTPNKGILLRIKNAHKDDIHGTIKMGDYLLTGSKDGYVKKWSLKQENRGEKIWEITHNKGANSIDYRFWVTALVAIDSSRFIFGTREGSFSVCNLEGRVVYTNKLDLLEENISKIRNKQRICCLTAFNEQLFIGQPTRFASAHLKNLSNLNYTTTSPNDWVYYLHPSSRQEKPDLFVVTGSQLALWSNDHGSWERKNLLWNDDSKLQDGHRPYISSLTDVAKNSHLLAMSLFNGHVRVIDKEKSPERFSLDDFHEHTGRVWKVISPQPHTLISCADDGLIKIWDIRQQRSIETYGPYGGRVPSVLATHIHVILAASCPSQPTPDRGAELFFIDLRK